jgi:Cytochrome P460
VPPADYRDWVFLTSGLDMSYSDMAMPMGHSMFDNVFVDPAAWRAFQASGHWPDKTVFMKEARVAGSRGSINKHGQYQEGEVIGLEAHVRDDARFKGGWGFFEVEGMAPAKVIGPSASCYACHQAHAAVDTTFVQFYPTARPIAVKAGTFKGD